MSETNEMRTNYLDIMLVDLQQELVKFIPDDYYYVLSNVSSQMDKTLLDVFKETYGEVIADSKEITCEMAVINNYFGLLK